MAELVKPKFLKHSELEALAPQESRHTIECAYRHQDILLQAVELSCMLRAMPNLNLMRPAGSDRNFGLLGDSDCVPRDTQCDLPYTTEFTSSYGFLNRRSTKGGLYRGTK